MAVNRAASADVKAFAQKDVDDHFVKVNDELKSIAAAQSLPLKSDLDGALQKKLDRLGKLTGPAFDKAYVSEMKSIHHKDEGIFAKEAKNAASPDWKAFAAKTDGIVKGHIDELGRPSSSASSRDAKCGAGHPCTTRSTGSLGSLGERLSASTTHGDVRLSDATAVRQRPFSEFQHCR